MTVGERITARREELGMTKSELASLIGISKATVTRYEQGKIEEMGVSKLGPIANALRTTPQYLMGWENNANAPPATTEGALKTKEALRLMELLPPEKQDIVLGVIRAMLPELSIEEE